jgi:hypothetical protein
MHGSIAHCLVNTPDHLIEKEKSNFMYKNPELGYEELEILLAEIERNYKYDDIPIEDRVHIFEIERNDTDIERLKARIEDCRIYIHNTFNL